MGDAYSMERSIYFSVPQGSCCGPILYLAYTAGMEQVVLPHSGMDINGYTDGQGVKKQFEVHHIDHSLEINTIWRVETSATKIKNWMYQMQLKMNDDKTEFIIFSSRRHLPKTITKHLSLRKHSYQMYNCHVQLSLHQEH